MVTVFLRKQTNTLRVTEWANGTEDAGKISFILFLQRVQLAQVEM